jgi:ribosome-associated toxin RatA of RatAB toxin-antitoxin module
MVSLPMAKPRFVPEDMSVKETDFVRSEFQVEPDVYCQIKDHVFNEALAKARDDGMKEARSQARTQLREEVKKELLAELMPQYKAVAEKEGEAVALEKARKQLEPELRKELFGKFREEWDSQDLTDEDKKAYSVGFREIEVESLTFATSASAEADRAQTGSSFVSKARHLGLAAALLGLGPYAIWLLSTKDWHTVPFWLTALPYAVALGYFLFWRPKSVTDSESLRTVSSEYLQLVSRARVARMVQVDTQTRRDVQAEMQAILNAKSRLDEKYKPSVNLIEEVKPQVKMRLTDEIDPEKIFAEEFDDKLKKEGSA